MGGLFGSSVLEAAVGVASVYLILAVFCSAMNEWIAHLLDARAKNLRQALSSMFSGQMLQDGANFISAFYSHPVVRGVSPTSEHFSYLPSRAFSAAVIDLATTHVEGSVIYRDLEQGISNLPAGPLRQTLLALTQDAAGDITRAQSSIEDWFNDNMERAAGWYRRRAQLWNLLLAVLVTVATNADTLHLLHRFWNESAVRSVPPATMHEIAPMMGWSARSIHIGWYGWLSRIIGWVLTTFAVSMGAPFWFDVMNRAVNIRNAARPPAAVSSSEKRGGLQ